MLNSISDLFVFYRQIIHELFLSYSFEYNKIIA